MTCVFVWSIQLLWDRPFVYLPYSCQFDITSRRVLSNYFQTSRGSVLLLSHHVGSVSSRRGDQTPLLYYTHLCCLVLCYVTCNRTELFSYVPLVWDITCPFIFTSSWGHSGSHTTPLIVCCDINCITWFAQVGHSRATEL